MKKKGKGGMVNGEGKGKVTVHDAEDKVLKEK